MPVSFVLVDTITTISELSGGVSVDITQLPDTINVITDAVKQPLLQDRELWAAVLTCIGAIGGSLYMGWKTMQATREANKNQAKIALLKFEQDTEFKRLEIREKLASAVSEVSQMALTFETDFETCISKGYPNFPRTEKDPPNIRELRLQSVQRCLDSFKLLSLSYHKLCDLLNNLALYVSTNDIATQRIREIFNWYKDKTQQLSSEKERLYVYISISSKGNIKPPQHLELHNSTQETLRKLRDNEIKVNIPIEKLRQNNK